MSVNLFYVSIYIFFNDAVSSFDTGLNLKQ
jgi:hypothetical protein